MAQSGATTPGQSWLEIDGNEGMLCIPQSSSITGTSQSDCLVSYFGHSLEGSYHFAAGQGKWWKRINPFGNDVQNNH